MLDTIRAIAQREGEGSRPSRPSSAARCRTPRSYPARKRRHSPVTGPIFRYANLFTMISGATSLDALAKISQRP